MNRKITVITGDTENLIMNGLNKMVDNKVISFENTKYIHFPEVLKHPKVYCGDLKEKIAENNNSKFIILTFSDNIVNLLGGMIEENKLSKDEIELKIITEDNIINCTYTEEGYLDEGYPIGYFNYEEL